MQQWTYGNWHEVDWKWYRLRIQNTSLRHDHLPNNSIRPKPRNNSIIWILGHMVYYMCSKNDCWIHLLYGFPAKSALEFLQEDWMLSITETYWLPVKGAKYVLLPWTLFRTNADLWLKHVCGTDHDIPDALLLYTGLSKTIFSVFCIVFFKLNSIMQLDRTTLS
jgi:hypothetical protein